MQPYARRWQERWKTEARIRFEWQQASWQKCGGETSVSNRILLRSFDGSHFEGFLLKINPIGRPPLGLICRQKAPKYGPPEGFCVNRPLPAPFSLQRGPPCAAEKALILNHLHKIKPPQEFSVGHSNHGQVKDVLQDVQADEADKAGEDWRNHPADNDAPEHGPADAIGALHQGDTDDGTDHGL